MIISSYIGFINIKDFLSEMKKFWSGILRMILINLVHCTNIRSTNPSVGGKKRSTNQQYRYLSLSLRLRLEF